MSDRLDKIFYDKTKPTIGALIILRNNLEVLGTESTFEFLNNKAEVLGHKILHEPQKKNSRAFVAQKKNIFKMFKNSA